jgi:hypothetical protein
VSDRLKNNIEDGSLEKEIEVLIQKNKTGMPITFYCMKISTLTDLMYSLIQSRIKEA